MPTTKQRRAAELLVGNGGNITQAMLGAGYTVATANTPGKLTESKGFQELLEESIPDSDLVNVHKELLGSKRLDHMVFPPYSDKTPDKVISDEDITKLLAEVGGTVRKIVHGDMARHVYFWTSNDKARQDALKLAYDLKGKVKATETPTGNTYNTFIQQNNLDPNTPEAKTLVDSTLDALMAQTKRKVVNENLSSQNI